MKQGQAVKKMSHALKILETIIIKRGKEYETTEKEKAGRAD